MNQKALAYHGIDNAAYAMRGGTGPRTVVPLLYSRSITRNPVFSAQKVYQDNRMMLQIPSDECDEGTYGTSAPDIAFEQAVGLSMPVQGGTVTTALAGLLSQAPEVWT